MTKDLSKEDANAEISSLTETPCVQRLLKDLKTPNEEANVKCIWVKQWSDGFDPSHTKSNRSQVWMKTLTFGSLKDPANTMIVAMANQAGEHELIEKEMLEEFELLRKGVSMCDGKKKHNVLVKAGILCTCVDRPERTKQYNVGDHNGTHSRCWGHATEIDGNLLQNHLPNCSKCQKMKKDNLNENISTSIFCDKGTKECGKWKLQENTFPMPEDFPTVFDERPGAPKPPLQRVPTRDSTELEIAILKCNWLKEAAIFAHHNLSTKNPVTGRSFWTMKSGTAFLRTCAMTGPHQKRCWIQ